MRSCGKTTRHNSKAPIELVHGLHLSPDLFPSPSVEVNCRHVVDPGSIRWTDRPIGDPAMCKLLLTRIDVSFLRCVAETADPYKKGEDAVGDSRPSRDNFEGC